MRRFLPVVLLVALASACALPADDPALSERASSTTASLPTTVAVGATTTTTSASDDAATTTTAPPTTTTLPVSRIISTTVDGVEYRFGGEDDCYRFERFVEGFAPLARQFCDTESAWSRIEGGCVRNPPAVQGLRDSSTMPCDIVVPNALFGVYPAEVAHLCLVHFAPEGGIDGVSFMEPEDDGRFLIVGGTDGSVAGIMPYTSTGTFWGDPPFDGPFSVAERLCGQDPPWAAGAVEPLDLLLVVVFGRDLGADSIVFIDVGLGPMGVSVDALDGEPIELPFRVPVDASSMTVRVTDGDGNELFDSRPGLPAAIQDELRAGVACVDAPVVIVEVSSTEATLGWASSAASAERFGVHVGTQTDRTPGAPCEARQDPPADVGSPDIAAVLEGAYRIEVAPAVLDLGGEWLLYVLDADDSGYALDMAHLRANPDELYWSYLFPETELRMAIAGDGDDFESSFVAIPVPAAEAGVAEPVLVIEVLGFEVVDGLPVLRASDVLVSWG